MVYDVSNIGVSILHHKVETVTENEDLLRVAVSVFNCLFPVGSPTDWYHPAYIKCWVVNVPK